MKRTWNFRHDRNNVFETKNLESFKEVCIVKAKNIFVETNVTKQSVEPIVSPSFLPLSQQFLLSSSVYPALCVYYVLMYGSVIIDSCLCCFFSICLEPEQRKNEWDFERNWQKYPRNVIHISHTAVFGRWRNILLSKSAQISCLSLKAGRKCWKAKKNSLPVCNFYRLFFFLFHL